MPHKKKTDMEAAAAVAARLRKNAPNLSQQKAREIVTKMLTRAENKKRGQNCENATVERFF